jgi:hypothetical protein
MVLIASLFARSAATASVDPQAAAAKTGDDAGSVSRLKVCCRSSTPTLAGQAFLRRASEELRDRACAGQADFVARGLIKSIMDSGDGKTCKSGWEAASADEEYFVPDLLGARPKKQALVMGSPSGHVLDASGKDGKLACLVQREFAAGHFQLGGRNQPTRGHAYRV